MPNEFINELKKWANEIVRSSAAGNFVGMHRAVELIAKHFVVQPHEVAVLLDALTPHKDELLPKLWSTVEQPAPGREQQRLRAID